MDERRAEAGDDEDLYDAYLDAAESGTPEDPAAFLARRGGGSAALRDRLTALHGMLAADGPRPAPAAVVPGKDGLPFERLGDFRLLRRLDEGGMGTVYLAEQVSLARTVALKVVRPELAGSATAAERFRREALAVARLRHDHVVAVHAVGEDAGVRWIAMEYVEGKSLDEILADAVTRGEPVPARDAVRWAARIARALDAAHHAGIVHRDVKPSNIRITPEGRPMLLDFGIARDVGAEGMTGSAPFVGSPAYAAPEQIAGESDAADARTDVYSLGVTLYECLAGRVPWRTGTVEQVFHAILADPPPRLRKLNPSIPRDVEVVVGKAMEKDPARRYASAAEFADDLDALLEFRAIRARPPSLPRRLAIWARRRPGPAAAAATVTLAAFALTGALVVQQQAAARQRRDEAARTLQGARDRIASYRERREATRDAESDVERVRSYVWSKHLAPEELRLLDEKEDAVAAFRRDREAVFHEVLDQVRRAESLDPAVDGAAAVRAELYLEKWREAQDLRNPSEGAYFRERLLASDPGGRFADEVTGGGRIAFASDPPGALVHLFRYEEQGDVVPGGEKRLVPVPFRGAGSTAPGTWALEVVDAAEPLRARDHVVAIDGRAVRDLPPAEARALVARGGVRARVVRDGAEIDADVPAAAGISLRSTAAPLLTSPQSLVGRTPLDAVPAEPGSYLALFVLDGREPVRRSVHVRRGVTEQVLATLLPAGASPRGFVRIEKAYDTAPPTFWIMEREVTASEYLAFLNDPATLAEIAESKDGVRFPRANDTRGGYLPRGADGKYALAPEWTPDWPILGVSLEDARAYTAWLTSRERAAGVEVTYALPTYDEWITAAGGHTSRTFVFGDRFRPPWAKSCYARPQANPEPVLSYPVDESIFGVFDLCGSAFEWCDWWYDEGRGLHRLPGGSWGRAKPEELAIHAPRGVTATYASGETGFRLVLRKLPVSR